MKYIPKRAITTPAILRNHKPAPCHELFSVSRRTKADELPAATIGRQCPRANKTIIPMPVITFCCTVTMARIGAMKPKVHDPDNIP